ncbi:ROK family protein [Pseudogracilibacillus sp. SE30717A]|uniref:ROK family protein n=1 Tax=Pseudogracilibacillus sp. SE30717A TaxID=3098293 RepID=UPI00300E4292
MRIAGIDIGGTSIKLGVFNRSGDVLDFVEYDTESDKGGTYIIQNLIKQIEQFNQIDAIGISTAGQVDRHNGIIVQESANIPQTSGLQIKRILEDHFNVPVKVENDVNAAALGENHFGVGKDYNDFLFLAYGTGIGGGIVVNSELYYGRNGYAAEFGHMITHGNGLSCKCGLKGCYETYASTTSLLREAQKIDSDITNGRIIFERFYENDNQIKEVIDKWVEEIAIGLTSIIHIFNPTTIVIGGGIMEQEVLVHMISEKVNEMVLESFAGVNIVKASLGNRAGMLGAVSLHV